MISPQMIAAAEQIAISASVSSVLTKIVLNMVFSPFAAGTREQQALRKEYVAAIRANIDAQMANVRKSEKRT